MRKQKAITNFAKAKNNDLTEIAQLVYNKMSGNADFPNPNPTLLVFQNAITEYSDALLKSMDGTKQDTAVKNAKRKILLDYLTKLANYVNSVAEGDVVKLEGSGFPLWKVLEPKGILPQLEFFKISEGENPGEIKIELSVMKRSVGYIVLYYMLNEDGSFPENDSEWLSKTFSKVRGLLKGLQSGKKYIFKAAALSPAANKIGMYNFTEPVEKFVQ